jgi:hypothetical protein
MNADEFGVVRGGLMEFELVWKLQIGANESGGNDQEANVRLVMDVARGHHVSNIRVQRGIRTP